MTKVTYTPEPGMPDETEAYGHSFKKGTAVEVTDPKKIAKFDGNRFFKVVGAAKAADDDAAAKAKAEADAKAKADAEAKAAADKAKADAQPKPVNPPM